MIETILTFACVAGIAATAILVHYFLMDGGVDHA